jgi:hypothetical protein
LFKAIIGAFSSLFELYDLRGLELGGALRVGIGIGWVEATSSKVTNFELEVFIQQKVFKLDVPMTDPFLMHLLKP